MAREVLAEGTVCGLYLGNILWDGKKNGSSKDMRGEHTWVASQTKDAWLKMNTYLFDLQMDQRSFLVVSGYGRGNLLLKVNAPTTYRSFGETEDAEEGFQANVKAVQVRYKEGIPCILLMTTKKIEKGEELLLDYGKVYWEKMDFWKGDAIENQDAAGGSSVLDRLTYVIPFDAGLNPISLRYYTKKLDSSVVEQLKELNMRAFCTLGSSSSSRFFYEVECDPALPQQLIEKRKREQAEQRQAKRRRLADSQQPSHYSTRSSVQAPPSREGE